MNPLERLTVRSSVRDCKNCALHNAGSGPIAFRGPSEPRLVVVGEAPGEQEDIQRAPFVGPSGMRASAWLSAVGFDIKDVAWLNVVSCFPRRTPSPREVAACSHNLSSQLSHLRPAWLLVLGGVAVSAWWGDGFRMGDVRGKFWTVRYGPRTVRYGTERTEADRDGEAWAVSTWHPSAVLRNPTLDEQALGDVRSLYRWMTFGRNPLDFTHGALTEPFNDRCILCGDVGDHWLAMDGTEDKRGRGTMPYCQKHWDVKMGNSGRGRTKGKGK